MITTIYIYISNSDEMEFCIYLKPIFLFLHMHAHINRYDIVIIMPMMSCVAWC